MRKLALALALSLGGLTALQAETLKVNGYTVSESLFNATLQQMIESGQEDSPALRKQVRERLILSVVLAQRAQAAQLDKQVDLQQQLVLVERMQLSDAYLRNHIAKLTIDQKSLQAEYDAQKPALAKMMSSMPAQWKLRHIMVDNAKDAGELLQKLRKGANFAELAKLYSRAPEAKSGGLLVNQPEAFAELFGKDGMAALSKLPKGKVYDKPLKTQYGYHVVLMEDVSAARAPTLQDFRPQLEARLKQKRIEQLLDEIHKSTKVE
ncbi:peptidylprolyl isomerase [Leeia aquatica]|uniref:peptidylprolyl isomerase n=1 Tax=Leeia aquatica TaxID=2725557 RepID=A0A847S4C0_9NEIS|nr:peptidylprolyl isomerase [Leeia aquatica]NLR74614.1 hypothetical protein [Leeia aquatica]